MVPYLVPGTWYWTLDNSHIIYLIAQNTTSRNGLSILQMSAYYNTSNRSELPLNIVTGKQIKAILVSSSEQSRQKTIVGLSDDTRVW